MPRPKKTDLLRALRERVAEQLSTVRESQRAAQEGAVHEEARQEDPKDTRAIESQYIARGLAERVEGLEESVRILQRMTPVSFSEEDPIAVSALVGLSVDGTEKIYFIVPTSGGETFESEDYVVQTLTPKSPMGRELCGKQLDDEVQMELPGRRIEGLIDWVE